MRLGTGPMLVEEVFETTPLSFHLSVRCYGLCDERLHLFVTDGAETMRVRHGDGEAVHTFAGNQQSMDLLEWIASVHRYEEGR